MARIDPELDLVLERVVDVPVEGGVGGMDHPGAPDEVVHTPAVADRRL